MIIPESIKKDLPVHVLKQGVAKPVATPSTDIRAKIRQSIETSTKEVPYDMKACAAFAHYIFGGKPQIKAVVYVKYVELFVDDVLIYGNLWYKQNILVQSQPWDPKEEKQD